MVTHAETFKLALDYLREYLRLNTCTLSQQTIDMCDNCFTANVLRSVLAEIERIQKLRKEIIGLTIDINIYKNMLVKSFNLLKQFYPNPKEADWTNFANQSRFYISQFEADLYCAVYTELEQSNELADIENGNNAA